MVCKTSFLGELLHASPPLRVRVLDREVIAGDLVVLGVRLPLPVERQVAALDAPDELVGHEHLVELVHQHVAVGSDRNDELEASRFERARDETAAHEVHHVSDAERVVRVRGRLHRRPTRPTVSTVQEWFL